MQENVSFSENYLKCREKILGTEKWVEGFVIPQTTKDQELHSFMVITNVMAPGSLSKQDMIEIDPDTICRHTGYQKNGLNVWENDYIKYHFGKEIGVIRFGEYQNCFDSQTSRHDGFYVDWGDNEFLRKDLGYWINLEDDNVIPQNKGEKL